jgi:predicted nucleic acid-binding protein
VKKIFFDSDVLLDAALRREPFYLSSINLLELCNGSNFKAVTSANAFLNTYYFLAKLTPLTKIQSLKRLRNIVSIADVNEKMVDLAFGSNFIDFEDAVQFYAAKATNADFIITRNIKDYKQSDIPVFTAEQFLKTL